VEAVNLAAAADLEEAEDAEMDRLSSNGGYRCYLYIVFVNRTFILSLGPLGPLVSAIYEIETVTDFNGIPLVLA